MSGWSPRFGLAEGLRRSLDYYRRTYGTICESLI